MENSQSARQQRHYRAVRERLVRAGDGGGRSAAMAELRSELSELTADNAAKARRIAMLETDLADAEARLLAQAKALLAGRQSDGVDADRTEERPSIDTIIAGVLADFPGVTWEDVISVRRERRLVKPRHACMRAVYESRPDLSLPRIGRIFRRDHTSVLSVVKSATGHSD
ncbi:helix-turn-helix domain-containing protein [Ensifer sp. LCM 4579]|uniref:helix-turn-helix domain-containing protein n=1 Tax=Ensifer sp. LCM 4579 TaxID=1848292 RepID=UPI0008D95F34|nr:helix-turn-helix domain-containing protein [Ensifer sp. LCM 4579]OHV77993.1 chromosomal replication initiator DnaA [Ensifer sp. LCM 4579]